MPTDTCIAAAAVLQVELLEQFYEALCSLVERLRLSDPLCLTLVHKVGGCSYRLTGCSWGECSSWVGGSFTVA
jgi:hypothetical protein